MASLMKIQSLLAAKESDWWAKHRPISGRGHKVKRIFSNKFPMLQTKWNSFNNDYLRFNYYFKITASASVHEEDWRARDKR